MKKTFQTKYLSIFLGLLFLLNLIPAAVFAQEGITYYKSTSTVTITNKPTKIGTTTIINRSDKTLFVPNKTSPEIDSFAKNAPPYVEVAVCGDFVCQTGEDYLNCPRDCRPFVEGYCGDGICDSNAMVNVYSIEPIEVPNSYTEVCVNKTRWGWWFSPIVGIVLLVTDNYYYTECDSVYQKVYTH